MTGTPLQTANANGSTILLVGGEARMTGPHDLGYIFDGIQAHGGRIDWVDAINGDSLPADASAHDGLVLSGGELSVFDPGHADLVDGICDLYLAFQAAGKPVLGSCLGAQLMTFALGGRVERMEDMELGFAKLSTTPAAADDPVLGGATGEWLLYEGHRDRFIFPEGSVPLMLGQEEPNQVFRVDPLSYGFQCHFEATPELLTDWMALMRTDLASWLGDEGPRRVDAVLDDAVRLMPRQKDFAGRVMAGWMGLFE